MRPFAAVALAAALVVPIPVAAAIDPGVADESASPTYDTPAPKTPKTGGNTKKNNNKKKNSDTKKDTGSNIARPAATPEPTPEPITLVQAAPAKAALAPLTSELIVALGSDDRPAPLQRAISNDFFEDAGFDSVELVAVDSPLDALQSGEADFAVVDTIEALEAFADDPSLQAVAGYENYAGEDGAFGGSLLMAAPGLVAAEPSTVSAFTKSYLRGLRKFSKKADDADAFKPLDGGFGRRKDDGGWGELSAYAFAELDEFPDIEAFVSEHTLNVAQASTSTKLNPTSDLAGRPASSAITVASPPKALAGGPVQTALREEYFESAGLDEVNLKAVEEPLLGLLQGDIDIAAIDAADAADGFAQGLPLAVIAAHRNYGTDGEFGGDVLAVSDDFLETEGSTVTSFLTAYMRAMKDFQEDGEAEAFAPFDGGFGAYDPASGWTEFTDYITEATGEEAEDLEGLIVGDALERARTWWGIPSAPATDTASASVADAEETE